MASPDIAASSVVILGHCTRATKNGIIPDSRFHHQVASMKQVNPVISPLIWKHSIEEDDENEDRMMDLKDVWAVTYNLVCNSPPTSDASIISLPSAPVTFVDAVNGVVSELQKLSMVMLIRGHKGGDYQDFVYRHTHINCKVYYYPFLFTLFSATT